MDIQSRKKLIELEFETVRQARSRLLEQIQQADIRLAQLQGKMELLLELEKETATPNDGKVGGETLEGGIRDERRN
mgnify:CR=1 FL=1